METTGQRPIDDNGLHHSHYTGAVGETIARLYFLTNGYQVWTPDVAQGHVDLIVSKNGESFRVQVKTAFEDRTRQWCYIKSQVKSRGSKIPASQLFDYLFVVKGWSLWLIPAHLIDNTSCICLDSDNPKYKSRGENFDNYRVDICLTSPLN